MTLTKTASLHEVHPAGQVTFTLVVANHGPGEAKDVMLQDPAPAGLVFTHVETSQGRCKITTGLHCALGTVHAGGRVQIQLTANVAAHACGAIRNTATVWDHEGEPHPANNTATSTIHVTPCHVTPETQAISDLAIAKHVDRHTALLGQRLRYTITVTNHGPDPADHVRVTDTLTLPVRILRTSTHAGQGHCTNGPVVVCALGTLPAGAHTTITVVAMATVAGAQANTAAVTSDSRDSHPHNNLAAARTRILAPTAPPPPKVTG